MSDATPQEILADLFAKYPELKTVAAPVAKLPGLIERWFAAVAGYLRMSGWGLAAVVLGIGVYLLMPQEIEVAHWKAALLALAAYGGYWLDRALFPYARPHTLQADEKDGVWTKDDPLGHVYLASMLRRSLLVSAAMLAMAMAL